MTRYGWPSSVPVSRQATIFGCRRTVAERLTSEPIREVGVGRSLGSEQLDGDATLQPEIHRLVDRRHPAPPDDPAELVAVADDPRLAGIRHGGTLAETA